MPTIQDFVASSEIIRPRDAAEIVEAWGLGQDALAQMPMATQPERLKSTLLPYQRQGLAWMLEKEHPVLPAVGSTDIVQLWKRERGKFRNIASQHTSDTPPVLARGMFLFKPPAS